MVVSESALPCSNDHSISIQHQFHAVVSIHWLCTTVSLSSLEWIRPVRRHIDSPKTCPWGPCSLKSKNPTSVAMPLNLDALPFDILFTIALDLSVDDIVHLGRTCRQLRSLLKEDTLCRKVIEVRNTSIIPLASNELDILLETLHAFSGSTACLRRAVDIFQSTSKNIQQTYGLLQCDTIRLLGLRSR